MEVDANVLIEAFRKCSKNSRWKESTQRYEMNLLRNTLRLKKELENRTYRQKDFHEFTLSERGKTRNIRSMHISDRVVQRAYCDNVLIPAVKPKLIYDNGASLEGKGIDFARRRLDTHLRRHVDRHGDGGYILLMDFSKFFDSIPHGPLKAKLAEVLDDPWLANLMIDSFAVDGEAKSIGIGSQISQVCGIYYPTAIDVYCTAVRGHKGYGRYMDDIYVLDTDKARLRETYEAVCNMADDMGLTVNRRKSGIVKLTHGFTWLQVKYRVKDGRIIKGLRPSRITREKRRLRKFRKLMDGGKMPYRDIEDSYRSWRGNAKRLGANLNGTDKLYNDLFIKDFKTEVWR